MSLYYSLTYVLDLQNFKAYVDDGEMKHIISLKG